MRIVTLSDTHNQHRMLTDMPDGDMIIHAGDISMAGYIPEVADFVNWFASLPYKYKVFIAGNHDFCMADSFRKNRIREALMHHPDIIYLEDESITIEGIKIYGAPWTPKYYDWAFNMDRGAPIKTKWALIPEDTDIVVVHGPPKGYGDLVTERNENVGCEDLYNRLLEVKPKLCIFGHIHEGYGMYTLRVPNSQHQVTCMNVSVLDNTYYLVNDPVVIDYEDFI